MPSNNDLRQIGVPNGVFVLYDNNISSGVITKKIVISAEQAQQYTGFKIGEEAFIVNVPSKNFADDNSHLIFKKKWVFETYDEADAAWHASGGPLRPQPRRQRRGHEFSTYDC